MYVCEVCGNEVLPDALGVCKKITGWVENKKTGTGNSVIRKYVHGVYAHRVCLEIPDTSADRLTLF
jgi:hypothetical protein